MDSNTIDIDNLSFNVAMIKFAKKEGHVNYIFKVVGPRDISFHLEDRYSSIRSFQQTVIRNLDDNVSLKSVPKFPAKKYMNSLNDQFLDNRMTQLGNFLNGFFKVSQIAKSNLVMTYFVSKAADQESQEKIIELRNIINNEKQKQKKADPSKGTSKLDND